MTGEFLGGEFSMWGCVWQSTIFAMAGLVGSFIMRHRSARAHQVLFLAMIAAVIAPMMSTLVKHYELGVFVAEPVVIQPLAEDRAIADKPGTSIIPAEDIELKPVPTEGNSTPVIAGLKNAEIPWRSVVLVGWIAVSLILAARLLVTFALGVRLLGRALPLDCERIEQAMHLARTRLGIDKDVKVYSSRGIRSPVIWCWKRSPVLLVPSAAGRSDNVVDWAGVLCHELAHWKRRDHISGLLAELVVCILPWQALLWWAKSRLISLSEQACDDWVVATGQAGTDYAESLLDLTPGGQMAFVPAVVRSKRGLAGRVRRILKDSCSNPHTGAIWALTVSLAVICLAVGVAFAQQRPSHQTGTVKTKVSQSATIVQPASAMLIKGRILDPNNEPAYLARIIALPVTSYGFSIWLNNKEGYFELPWSTTWIEEGQPIFLIATGHRQRNEAAFVEVHDPTSLVTVRLEPASKLVGKVVDPNGQRIAKYTATLSLATKFKCQAPIFDTTVVGRETIFSQIPYTHGPKYKLTVQAKGYQTKQLTVDPTDKSKEVIDIGTITLQPQDPAKPVVTEKSINPDLAKEFHEIYRLEEEEVIKLIKPPFVLGRQEYLNNMPAGMHLALQHLGLQTGFSWDGELEVHSAYSDSKLWWVLRLVLDIPVYDFNLPEELNVRLPVGDWIVRAGLPVNEQLRALEEILHAEMNRAIRFEKRTAEREVIVVRGRFEFKPHPSGNHPNYIPLTCDDRVTKTETKVDSLAEFLRYLERVLEIKIVDETEPIENTTIRYRSSGGLRLGWMTDPVQRGERLSALLDNLAKTTSLDFKVELQPAEMWFVTE